MSESFSNLPEVAPPERLVSDYTLRLLVGVGNHEAKALTLLYLGQADAALDRHQMGLGFGAWLGPTPPWKPAPGIPFGYCEQSFQPIGQVVQKPARGPRDTAVGYELSESGRTRGLPLAGLLLDWSLRYPDVSLQNVFGPTFSLSQTRAPQHRLRVLLDLLTAPGGALSTADFAGSLNSPADAMVYYARLSKLDRASRELERNNLVSAERVIQPFKTDYDTLPGPYPDKRSAAELRAQLARPVGSQSVKYSVESPAAASDRRRQFSAGHFTKVSLIEDYRPALEDLLNIVLAVESPDSELLDRGRALAKRLSHDDLLKARLIAKAYRFSPAAKRHNPVLTARPPSRLPIGRQESPRLAPIVPALPELFDKSITPQSLKKLLGDLATKRLGPAK
ncbi:MAG: hypothetical protein ABI602_03155 [Candidatus Saccharibacteria bacterium]